MNRTRLKVMSVAFVGLLLVLVPIYVGFQNLYMKNVRAAAMEHLLESQELFNAHMTFDTEKLTAVLNMFLRDEEFKRLFAERNREQLYRKGLPLYTMLHERYGITHFYFHLPNEINFLRLHRKELYGDEIRRETFRTAVVTRKMACGIELGKTSFALRIVSPYYQGTRLLGYVEIGEEIDHFLDLIQKPKKNVFAILAEKGRMDKDEWVATNQRRGLTFDWDALTQHAWVTRPDENFIKGRYVTEANLKQFEFEPSVLPLTGDQAGQLVFGGFPLFDIQGKHVGIVVTLINVSSQMQALVELRMLALIVVSVFILLIMVLVWFLARARERRRVFHL